MFFVIFGVGYNIIFVILVDFKVFIFFGFGEGIVCFDGVVIVVVCVGSSKSFDGEGGDKNLGKFYDC